MNTKIMVFVGILLSSLALPSSMFAGTGSSNFRLQNSVLSGGGAFMISVSYLKDATLGQPTFLMNPSNPFYSDHYYLYPGFWYALGPSELSEPIKSFPWLLLLLD